MFTSTIPLFPLTIVVFPESKYPLHIFEERYKRMIRRCQMNDEGFGITVQSGSDFAQIGSYVRIAEILKEYESGEMDIVIQGINRFTIQDYQLHPDGYYEADVNNFRDLNPVQIDKSILDELKAKFKEIISKVNFKLDKHFWDNLVISSKKSFKIAEKAGLTLQQQQALLSLQDENKRIQFLLNHFYKLEKQIDKDATLKGLIIGDGYINK